MGRLLCLGQHSGRFKGGWTGHMHSDPFIFKSAFLLIHSIFACHLVSHSNPQRSSFLVFTLSTWRSEKSHIYGGRLELSYSSQLSRPGHRSSRYRWLHSSLLSPAYKAQPLISIHVRRIMHVLCVGCEHVVIFARVDAALVLGRDDAARYSTLYTLEYTMQDSAQRYLYIRSCRVIPLDTEYSAADTNPSFINPRGPKSMI